MNLFLSTVLFFFGLMVFMINRNVIKRFIGIEIMFLSSLLEVIILYNKFSLIYIVLIWSLLGMELSVFIILYLYLKEKNQTLNIELIS